MKDKIIPKQNNQFIASLNKPFKVGDIIKGKIIGLERASIYLDLSPIGTGVIAGKEFYEAKSVLRQFKKGDILQAKIINSEEKRGYIELSFNEARMSLSWDDLENKKRKGDVITIKVIGANKGGLLTELDGIAGFIPVSQLSAEHYPRVEEGDKMRILKKLQKFIGQELKVKIINVSKKEGKLILSEKASTFPALKELLKNYKEGSVVEGTITGVTDFGAFIKFPFPSHELEGLIHISELDWKLVKDPNEIIKIGDRIKAKIIEINKEGKIFLSLKALKENPWQEIEKKFKKGSIIKGLVTKLNPFGAFVQVTPEIQGLAHVSSFRSLTDMEHLLKEGEKYKFQILSIDSKEHRISLKLI